MEKEGDLSVNLDRFSHGIKDPQEAKAMAYCAGCGGEIYENEYACVWDNQFFHRRFECIAEYLGLKFVPVEDVI